MDLLRCLSSQPQAAAQATALSLGAYHTVALMAQKHGDPPGLQLYAFGRGEHTETPNLSHLMYLEAVFFCYIGKDLHLSCAGTMHIPLTVPVLIATGSQAESETEASW